jgi:hypothetical protein
LGKIAVAETRDEEGARACQNFAPPSILVLSLIEHDNSTAFNSNYVQSILWIETKLEESKMMNDDVT